MSDVLVARVLDGAGEAFVRRGGVQLPALVGGLTATLADIDDLAVETPGGWPALADLDTTPDPRWLGTVVTGTRIPYGMTPDAIRALIRERPAWRRGTAAAMKAAAYAAFADGLITFVERDGSPWRLTVRLYAAGSTAADRERVAAAVTTHKPVGIVLNVVTVTGATYAHLAAEHGPTFADMEAEFPTYQDMTEHIPEGGTTP